MYVTIVQQWGGKSNALVSLVSYYGDTWLGYSRNRKKADWVLLHVAWWGYAWM